MKTLEIIATVIVVAIALYIATRIMTRAGLDEVDKFLNRKSRIKKQENGTEEEEK